MRKDFVMGLTGRLRKQFADSDRLEVEIKRNLRRLGYILNKKVAKSICLKDLK